MISILLTWIFANLSAAQTPHIVAPVDPEEKLQNDRCQRKVGDQWLFVGWRNCLKLGPPEHIHGVWYAVFEQQGFVEGVDVAAMEIENDVKAPEYSIWLDIDSAAAMKMAGQPEWAPCVRAVTIDFIGRRPADLAEHATAPDGLVVVDRLLSAKYLGQVKERGVPEEQQDCNRSADEVEP